MQGHETREEREERLCPRCWAERFVVGTGKETRSMEWEPPSIEICLRCAEGERQDSMLESDSPPPTMWPLPPDFLAREWLTIVRQRQQAERQRLEAELQQLCDAAEWIGREEVLHLPGDREVLQEAILATTQDGWMLRALTVAESDRIIAAYRRGVAARAQAEKKSSQEQSAQEERPPRDESSERSKMLKRLHADPRARVHESPRSTLVMPLNAKELAQLKRNLGREQPEEPRDERPPLAIDAYDPDWIKRGPLDLPQEIQSVPGMRRWLATIGMTVANFKKQQAYLANVDRLPWLREL